MFEVGRIEPHSTSCQAAGSASRRPPPGQPAPREQLTQLDQRGVGRQRVHPRAGGRGDRRVEERPRSRSTTSSPPISAYLRRSAISSARVPEQVTRRHRPRSSSKSASQIHETSRPSAIRSLSAIQRSSDRSRGPACAGPRSCPPGSSPAGSRPRDRGRRSSRRARMRPRSSPETRRWSRGPRPASTRCRGCHRVVDVVEPRDRQPERELALRRAQLDPRARHTLQMHRFAAISGCGRSRPQRGQQ